MVIEVRRKQGLKLGQTLTIGAFEWVVDLSVEDGGDGEGPSPHDLYDAALGACNALTVMWHAARKGIPVGDVAVTVSRDASQERAGTYALSTTVRIGGPVSDAQLRELHAVADKCPIHKLMTAVSTTIRTDIERMS